jgi:hypothetical protein
MGNNGKDKIKDGAPGEFAIMLGVLGARSLRPSSQMKLVARLNLC